MEVVSIAIALALIAAVIFTLNKIKVLNTVAIVFLAVILTFLVMALVPALQIEPVYSMLKGFLYALPQLFGNLIDYLGKMFGGLF